MKLIAAIMLLCVTAQAQTYLPLRGADGGLFQLATNPAVTVYTNPLYAIRYFGVTGVSSIGDQELVTSNMSLVAWFNIVAYPSKGWMGIMGKWDNLTTDKRAYHLSVYYTGVLVANSAQGVGGPFSGALISPAAVSTGAWHHVAYILDCSAGSTALYLDGVVVTNMVTSNTAIVDNAAEVTIGATFIDLALNSQNYYNGIIDEPLIFSRALTSNEVYTLYASGSGVYGTTNSAPWNSGLAAGWHFDENTGTKSIDFSGNNYTNTHAGDALWTNGFVRGPNP